MILSGHPTEKWQGRSSLEVWRSKKLSWGFSSFVNASGMMEAAVTNNYDPLLTMDAFLQFGDDAFEACIGTLLGTNQGSNRIWK